eukprot:370983-Lingulodinium_polyedra.AAC.1
MSVIIQPRFCSSSSISASSTPSVCRPGAPPRPRLLSGVSGAARHAGQFRPGRQRRCGSWLPGRPQ